MFKHMSRSHLKDKVKLLELQNHTMTLEMQNHSYPAFPENTSALQACSSGETDDYNPYLDSRTALKEINAMYNGERAWGFTVGNVADLRAAFVLAGGPEVEELEADSGREVAFAQEFLKYNKWAKKGFIDIVKGCELEGKVLLRLVPIKDYQWTWKDGDTEKKETGMILVQYYSWCEYNYTVTADRTDIKRAVSADISTKNESGASANTTASASSVNNKNLTFLEPEMAYLRMRGKPGDLNHSIPVVSRCVHSIIGAEKVLADTRLNNNLQAGGKPVLTCKDYKEAEAAQRLLEKQGGINMNNRKVYITTGILSYLSPPPMKNPDVELKNCRRNISFTTGIPTSLLGDPDDVMGKAVQAGLMEQTGSYRPDRENLAGLIAEAINKGMDLINGVNTPYRTGRVGVHILETTAQEYERIKEVYQPAADGGYISKETFIELLPGVDAGQELKRLEAQKEDKGQEELDFFDNVTSSERAEEVEQGRLKENGREQNV